MLSIFDYSNYRSYLEAWIESQGARAHGSKGRLAQALGVSSTLISLIFKGDKTLTSDQGSELSDYLGLTDLESDYLHLLVELERAGTHRYRLKLERKIRATQEQARKIGKRVPRDKELSDEQKSVYYSDWTYTAVRNLTAVPTFGNVAAIAKHLNLEEAQVQRVVRFLIENGLCKEAAGGGITYGPAGIHVDRESHYVNQHHKNWRLAGMRSMEHRREADLFFTSPMSLSRAAAQEVRTLLPTVIQNVVKIVGPSDSEVVACMNIDWFQY